MDTKSMNVHQRLAAAMGEVDYIQKESKKGMNYTIVSHDAVTAKVRPVLLKNGIVYYPVRCEHVNNGNRAECSMTVRFVNVDEPTDYFEVPTFGYGIDTQDKGPGKAMSYAVKYALLKALGLETGDDPDHDNIPHEKTPAKQSLPKQKETPKDERQPSEREVSLWKEMNAITSLRGLKLFWQDYSSDLKYMGEEVFKRFEAKKDQLKGKLPAEAKQEDDRFPGDEPIRDVSGREMHNVEA